jgi:hypothetical protein
VRTAMGFKAISSKCSRKCAQLHGFNSAIHIIFLPLKIAVLRITPLGTYVDETSNGEG